MKSRGLGLLCCASAALLLNAASSNPLLGAANPHLTLHTDRSRSAVNPYIYGQFIEHLGRCIYGGIWAEMLEDRKFYFPITAEYRPYLELAGSPFPVVGSSPWEIVGSPTSVAMQVEDAFVGEHSPLIQPGAGIRQNDLGVRAGRTYEGAIWLAAPERSASVQISLIWDDSTETGRATHAISRVTSRFKRTTFELIAGEDTDHARFEVRVNDGPVRVGTVSLMPADNVRGMRADTLALLRQLGATMYRWPGGNFVSGYNWRDGIGDRDRRPPRPNPAWTGVEHNDFGLDEFLDFCREVSAEPVIAVNTGFGDAYSAAQEVEYCNGSRGTAGGTWRARNGHRDPYGVTYWCVGNEMFGPWQLGFMQLAHYTRKHNDTAAAMRAVDPGIQLIGVGNLGGFNRRHDPEQEVGWSRGMLEQCSESMNLISEHFYRGRNQAGIPAHVDALGAAIREKAEGHRKLQQELGLTGDQQMPIAMDEWNYWHNPYLYGELGCVYDLSDALGVAVALHEYFRNSDLIQMAHYAQTVNVIGCIKTTKTEAFFATTALPLMLYRHQFGTRPIEISGNVRELNLDIMAAWTANEKALTIGAVNSNPEAVRVGLDTGPARFRNSATAWLISGEDPAAYNEPGQDRVRIVETTLDLAGELELPPYSITLVRWPRGE